MEMQIIMWKLLKNNLCLLILSFQKKNIGTQLFLKVSSFAKDIGYEKGIIDARINVMNFYDSLPGIIHTGRFWDKPTGPHEWLEVDFNKIKDGG